MGVSNRDKAIAKTDAPIFCTINRPIFGVFFLGEVILRKPAEFVGLLGMKSV